MTISLSEQHGNCCRRCVFHIMYNACRLIIVALRRWAPTLVLFATSHQHAKLIMHE